MSEEQRKTGGQPDNLNAMKGIGVELKNYDLNQVSDCFRLLQVITEAVLQGRIGARAAGAANNAIRIILSYHSDIAQVAENKRLIEESKRRIKELEAKLDELQQPVSRVKQEANQP